MRVSTTQQVEEGDSIAAQRDALRKYINAHDDLIFSGEYLDDGISGTKADRDELQRMLSDIKAGLIDLVLCTKLDRLQRSLRNFLNMQDIMDKYKCNWLAIWEPMYDSSTPQGRMIINTMVNLAQFEAENTGSRIRQVMSYKVQQGEAITGIIPTGYKIENKHLVLDDHAEYIRKCFEYYAYTGNLNKTARYCSSFPDMPRTNTAYKKLLSNTMYTGLYRGNPNYCPAIVRQELFADVQHKLSMNVKISQKHTYIFSGLLVCAECGRRMASGIHRDKGKMYSVYRCPGRYNRNTHECKNGRTISEHVLEEHLIINFREWIESCIKEYSQEQPHDNSAQINTLKRKIDRLKDLYINDLITLDEYKADKEAYESSLSELEKEAPQSVVDLSVLEKYMDMDFNEFYWDLSTEEKRFFWRSVFRELRFGMDRKLDPVFLLEKLCSN